MPVAIAPLTRRGALASAAGARPAEPPLAAPQRRWRAAAAAFALACCALLAAFASTAHGVTAGTLKIGHPFARETPPGARAGAAYFTVANTGTAADRLVAVSSPAAASASLHSMAMEGTTMRMRAVSSLPVPAGGTLTLAPGGYHVMLEDLAKPLVKGDKIPLRLTFEKAGPVDVVVNVESMTAVLPHS